MEAFPCLGSSFGASIHGSEHLAVFIVFFIIKERYVWEECDVGRWMRQCQVPRVNYCQIIIKAATDVAAYKCVFEPIPLAIFLDLCGNGFHEETLQMVLKWDGVTRNIAHMAKLKIGKTSHYEKTVKDFVEPVKGTQKLQVTA